MGMYDRVHEAKVSDDIPFLGIGRYITKVLEAYGMEGRKNNFCKIKMEIVACLSDDCTQRVGDEVQVIYSKKNDRFDSQLKKFCMALGAAVEDVDNVMCERILPFWANQKLNPEPPQSNIEGLPLEWNGYDEPYTHKETGEEKIFKSINPVKVPLIGQLEDLEIKDKFEDVLDFLQEREETNEAFWVYEDLEDAE